MPKVWRGVGLSELFELRNGNQGAVEMSLFGLLVPWHLARKSGARYEPGLIPQSTEVKAAGTGRG